MALIRPGAAILTVAGLTTGPYRSLMPKFVRSMFMTRDTVLTNIMGVVAGGIVAVVCRVGVAYLTDTIIGFFTTYMGWECHRPETTYVTSYMFDIRAIVASLRILLLPRIVADSTILNMVIFGYSKRP
jgi:hypothetical protein